MKFKDSTPWMVTTCVLLASVIIQFLQYRHDAKLADIQLASAKDNLNLTREEVSQLQSLRHDLEAQSVSLNDKVIQLQSTTQQLESEIRELEAANAAQRKSTVYIQQIADDFTDGETKGVLSDLVQNSRYFVQISATRSDRDTVRRISAQLSERGYSVNGPVFYQNKPAWYPITNTVFYFSEESTDKADQLAEKIESIIDQDVIIERGPAARVARTNAEWKLEVSLLDLHVSEN